MNPSKVDKSILDIEIGGSIFELIEFTLNRQLPDGTQVAGRYGVNVAKVREVVRMAKINPLGSTVPAIPGIFELRGVPIPAVNLCRVLGDAASQVSADQQIIVAEFSNKRAGFIVSSTRRIRRVAWENVLPPSADHRSCMTGMILVENNEFLFILDLERILLDLERQAGYSHSSAETGHMPDISRASPLRESPFEAAPIAAVSKGRVLVVDDSQLIIDGLKGALRSAGYQIVPATNGIEALQRLEDSTLEETGIDAIITDLEMPKMDGVTLTKKVREHPIFSALPIIFHSSLSGQASMQASKAAGANGYVVKNDVKSLLGLLQKCVQFNQQASA
jgi:two-component system chemotaxis response regulator CheV